MNWLVAACQAAMHLLVHRLFIFFMRGTVTGEENLEGLPAGYIIAANHQSKLDPFLMFMVSWHASKYYRPLYQPTAKMYYRRLWFKPFILLGAYPVTRRGLTAEDILQDSIEKLRKGGKVIIFPEGRIVEAPGARKPKQGVSRLSEICQVPIVPMRIEGAQRIGLKDFFLRRRKVTVHFGAPISPLRLSGSRMHDAAATEIMDAIYGLP